MIALVLHGLRTSSYTLSKYKNNSTIKKTMKYELVTTS